ncbi:type 12 methyltransferase [Nitzschia inconspicua]|uniref:Type 12 methyltransferase n=1 Tax=Nitzschia inconspicua TaxID=303405 RepID=A0A9K3PHI5_9STRA|nr:type 12 methyltransferase [Nitzschia inconspicua]
MAPESVVESTASDKRKAGDGGNVQHPPQLQYEIPSPPYMAETPWTDAQIRWSEDEGVPEKEESPFFDPFADPDPTQVFTFAFSIPRHSQLDANSNSIINPKVDADDNQLSKKSSGDAIELKIQGYKTHSDQVWQSTGLTLWKASKYLCDYMVKQSQFLQHKRILELGAGLGLNGILAHRIAPHCSTVLVTDGDTDALVQLRKNIQTNRVSYNVSAEQLIWGQDTAQAFLKAQKQHQLENDGRFDVVLASDIIYSKVVIDPLWETIRSLLSRAGGSFWMAFARRKVPVSIDFVLEKGTEYGFRHKLVAESAFVDDENNSTDDGIENSKIEDAAGGDKVFIYVFEWEDESKAEVCRDGQTRTASSNPINGITTQSASFPTSRKQDAKPSIHNGFKRGFLLGGQKYSKGKKSSNVAVQDDVTHETKLLVSSDAQESLHQTKIVQKNRKPPSSGWTKGFLTSKSKPRKKSQRQANQAPFVAHDLLQLENPSSMVGSGSSDVTGNDQGIHLRRSNKQPLIHILDDDPDFHATDIGSRQNRSETTNEKSLKHTVASESSHEAHGERGEASLRKEASTTRLEHKRFPLLLDRCRNLADSEFEDADKMVSRQSNFLMKEAHKPLNVSSHCHSESASAENFRSILEFQRELENAIQKSVEFLSIDKREDYFLQLSSAWTGREVVCAWELVLTQVEGINDCGIKTLGSVLFRNHPTGVSAILDRVFSEDDRKMCLLAVSFLRDLSSDDLDNFSVKRDFQTVLDALVRLSHGERRTVLAQTAWETSLLFLAHAIRADKNERKNSSIGSKTLLATIQSLLRQQLHWQLSKKTCNSQKVKKLQSIDLKLNPALASQNSENVSLQEIASDLMALLGP